MTRAGEGLGLRVAHEAYADRLYGEDGMMLPRSSPGSVIRDADQAGEHVCRMAAEQAIFTQSGRRIPTPIDTFCIHGDEPTAVTILRIAETLQADEPSLAALERTMPEDAAAPEAVDVDALRAAFERRLAEQTERHDGGNHWIGTGGTNRLCSEGESDPCQQLHRSTSAQNRILLSAVG